MCRNVIAKWIETKQNRLFTLNSVPKKAPQNSVLTCLSLADKEENIVSKSNMNREGGEVKQLFPSIQPVEYFRFF